MAPRKESKKPLEPPVDPLSPFVGPLLLHAREVAGLKQEVVARKAGISDTTLRRIENGVGPLRNDYLMDICKVLGLNPDLVLLEALTPLWLAVAEKLARDPMGPVPFLREKVMAAVDARHQAERKEIDAKLFWDSFLFFKMKYVSSE